MAPLRLHLIGGAGTGKTYIAQRLSARLGVPTLDLDEIYWVKGTDTYEDCAPEAARDRQLADFIRQESWIVEGVYHRWLTPSFEAATHILVFMPPLWQRQARILRRYVRRKLGLEPGKKDNLIGLWTLLAWNHRYDRRELPQALARLKARQRPYVICRNEAEIEAAVARIDQ